MSRSKSTLKNLVFQFAYELLILLFGFIAPRWIIETYGSAVNGLTSTINQLLQILNLLQIGAVGASIFEMYKPVAEKDYRTISLIIDSSKRYFKKMGTIFLAGVVVAAPIIAYMKADEGIPVWAIVLSVIILGLNGSFYFFFTSWFDIMFSPHQKRFVLSISAMIEKIVYYGCLFAVLYFKLHFVLMYITMLVGSIVKVIYLYARYNKDFGHLMVPVKKGESYPIKNRNYLMLNQIARQTIESSPAVIVSMSYSLSYGSVYSVYHLVQNMIKMVINTMQHSVSEIFGTYVAKESNDRIKSVYNAMEYGFYAFGMVVISCTAFLYAPFVYLYTDGNSMDVNYMFPAVALLFVIYDAVYCAYSPIYMLSNVYGLFKNTYKQSLISGGIGLLLSIGLGMISWELILSGLVFYYGSSLIYRIYVLYKSVEWYDLKKVPFRLVTMTVALVLCYWAGNKFAIFSTSWIAWILQAVIIAAVSAGYVLIYTALAERKEFKTLLGYVKNMIKR